jgi:hypothetical protein
VRASSCSHVNGGINRSCTFLGEAFHGRSCDVKSVVAHLQLDKAQSAVDESAVAKPGWGKYSAERHLILLVTVPP